MSKVSRFAFVFAALAFASCVQEKTEEGSTPDIKSEESATNLTTVHLKSFAGNASRVSYGEGSRADADEAEYGTLELVASIANPSKAEGFNFTSEGRYLSATSIYYDQNSATYYVTYHMQGNNYNTELETDTAGAIQSFKINEEGKVVLGDGFRAQNPSNEDYDFNHIYFDNTDQRILAVGHKVNGSRTNTRAIVGVFNPADGTYTYAPVNTNEKEYDAEGKSLGYKDAGDVNSITRPNDRIVLGSANGYLTYFVATRKGLAALHADAANLFNPELNEDGSIYFVPTPGSAKSVVDNPGTGSRFDLLYLDLDKSDESLSYATSSTARIARMQEQTGPYASFGRLIDPYVLEENSPYHLHFNPQTTSIMDYISQQAIPVEVSPIDGKNTLCMMQNMDGCESYAALGTGGLYYYNSYGEGVLSFGNRPVNSVTADENQDNEGATIDGSTISHDGFIYIANGSKLTILHRLTLNEVASWNMPSTDTDGNDIASSANYIAVSKAPKGENGVCERTIAVAFGQEGVRVFRFTPALRSL